MSGNVDGIRKIAGGVTAAKGFKAASTAAGIKYRDRKDMALIYSEAPCKSAGTFTSNIVKAAAREGGEGSDLGKPRKNLSSASQSARGTTGLLRRREVTEEEAER